MEPQLIRKAFLRAFVRTMIENSYKPSKKLREEIKEQIAEEELREYEFETTLPPLPPLPPGAQQLANLPRLPQRLYPLAHPVIRSIPITYTSNNPVKINLGRVAQVLSDPSVFSVECTGPEKPVLVNRSGLIQAAPFTLSKTDISNILYEISDKTRIPLSAGLFTAAFQDLHITAVLSEYVGSRFLLQKISPMMRRF